METIEISSVGKLWIHPDVEEWLISEPLSVPFWGGKELRFTFQGDLEIDKGFLTESNKIVEKFLKVDNSEKSKFTTPIYEHYLQNKNFYDSQGWFLSPLELNNESEIWQYFCPQEIFICRGDINDKSLYILVVCECEWGQEHGLQLVFKNGVELSRVSSIDYSPTE